MVPALHLALNMEGRRSTRDQLQSFGLVAIRTICPAPGGAPKPMFDTYRAPSGPKVIPVGKVRPVATVLSVPLPLTHTTVPEPKALGTGEARDRIGFQVESTPQRQVWEGPRHNPVPSARPLASELRPG